MATMKKMAVEYRIAAAKLSLRIKEKKAMGAHLEETNSLKSALRDIRDIQRLLDGYYDIPRTCSDAAVGWKARRSRDDH